MRIFLADMFHLKNADSVFMGIILSIIGAIIGYFTNMLNENSNAFVAIAMVVFADFFSGVLKAIVNNNFMTRKALKVIYYLFTYWVVLAVTLSIEKGFTYSSWMSEAIMLPIIVFQMISFLKNLSLIGIIPKGLLLKILENIDDYKNDMYATVTEKQVE